MSDYTKLSNLVDDQFVVNKVFGYKYKVWDNEQRKMLMSETWVKGYRKMYTLETDKGTLDLSASQMGNLLESVTKDGRADINGRAFSVKSNGKSGMDIRYFLNAMKDAPPKAPVAKEADGWEQFDGLVPEEEPINMEDIPF
jgi:hypothetical protein